MSEAPKIPDWERIQKKTFTKWVNTHLNREWGSDHTIEDVITDWESGISLMELAVALYKENEKFPAQAVSMPKLKPRELKPTSRIQMITNLNTALGMLIKAGVSLKGVGPENLCDHSFKDKPTILGMVFVIILDYSARGFGGTASEVKRALLEWVNKNTEGYAKVNPPGVKNFLNDWKNGLAWCALIHRHRPDALDYEACLGKTNEENLELAFSVAEEQLDIPRLLDVEDMETPDEKSVITYTMEYFHRFASEGLKEQAARSAAEWLKFLRKLQERKNDYERRARILTGWSSQQREEWANFEFGQTQEEAISAFNNLRSFVTESKPPQEGEKMDLESLFVEIQTMLKLNGLAPFTPPEDVAPDAIEKAFHSLSQDQSSFASKVRENRFRFVEKQDDAQGDAIEKQIDEAFQRYDGNGSSELNQLEFNAACMEMGVALKTTEEKEKLFKQVAEGKEEISKASFKKWMVKRLVVSLDDPESVKNAFKSLADGHTDGITEAQMSCLSPEDKAFMIENMEQNENGSYNYGKFVMDNMGQP